MSCERVLLRRALAANCASALLLPMRHGQRHACKRLQAVRHRQAALLQAWAAALTHVWRVHAQLEREHVEQLAIARDAALLVVLALRLAVLRKAERARRALRAVERAQQQRHRGGVLGLRAAWSRCGSCSWRRRCTASLGTPRQALPRCSCTEGSASSSPAAHCVRLGHWQPADAHGKRRSAGPGQHSSSGCAQLQDADCMSRDRSGVRVRAREGRGGPWGLVSSAQLAGELLAGA